MACVVRFVGCPADQARGEEGGRDEFFALISFCNLLAAPVFFHRKTHAVRPAGQRALSASAPGCCLSTIVDLVNQAPLFGVSRPCHNRQDRRVFGEASAGDTMSHASNAEAVETFGRGSPSDGWNPTMLSHHRRCSSAPNFLSSWRGAGLPSLSSGLLAPRLRDHTIPEGRRFEASLIKRCSCWNSLQKFCNVASSHMGGLVDKVPPSCR